MDKKEKKRDVATFSNMMKELMNEPLDNVLVTLDRDLQHFMYGRIATLVKHNEGKPIGSIADISAVVGAALGDVLKEFTRNRVDGEKLNALMADAQENLVRGFTARAPYAEVEAPAEEPAAETTAEGQEV